MYYSLPRRRTKFGERGGILGRVTTSLSQYRDDMGPLSQKSLTSHPNPLPNHWSTAMHGLILLDGILASYLLENIAVSRMQ